MCDPFPEIHSDKTPAGMAFLTVIRGKAATESGVYLGKT